MSRTTALVFVLLLEATAADAQETRRQQIAELQAEKAERLEPEGPDGAERAVVRIMKSPLLAGTGGLFPWFGSVYEGTGFGFGGGYLRRMPRSSQLTAIVGVSVKASTLLRADYTAPRLFGDRIEPYASFRWARARDISFYGVGNESTNDARAGYDFDPAALSAGIAYRPLKWVRLTAGYEYIGFETRVIGSRSDPLTLERLSDNTRLTFNGSQASVAIDTRTSPSYSTHGSLLRAATSYYSETRDRPFEFRQWELEAAQLVPLVREQFVLAFRGLATFTNPDAGNSAPLALLPYIGSGNTLRGFANRRFVDRDRLLLTGEYRWRPSRYLDMAIFLDAGQVAPAADLIAWERMKTSWGIGARFHGPTFSAFRLEVAHSVEGYHLVFTAGPPF
jgi:outer membrane protein assembly factor BamA